MTPKSDKEIEVTDVAEEENYAATRKSAEKEENTEQQPQTETHIEPPLEAPPQKARKVEDGKLPCPDCGRLLSKKTLNYSHKYQCRGKKNMIEIEDVQDDKSESPKERPTTRDIKQDKPSQPKAPVTNTRRPPVRRYDHISIF